MFYLRSKFPCCKQPIDKFRINSKMPRPQSPSILVTRLRQLKGNGDENGETPVSHANDNVKGLSQNESAVLLHRLLRTCGLTLPGHFYCKKEVQYGSNCMQKTICTIKYH